MNYCIDLILGKAFCIFIFFHFPDSRLSVLKGFHFYFCFLTWVKTENRLQKFCFGTSLFVFNFSRPTLATRIYRRRSVMQRYRKIITTENLIVYQIFLDMEFHTRARGGSALNSITNKPGEMSYVELSEFSSWVTVTDSQHKCSLNSMICISFSLKKISWASEGQQL